MSDPVYLRGGVISYLIHLTGLLKSSFGRRWAYVEHQTIVGGNLFKNQTVRYAPFASIARNVCIQRGVNKHNHHHRQPDSERKLRYSVLSGCRGTCSSVCSNICRFQIDSISFITGDFGKNKLFLDKSVMSSPREGVGAC